MVKVFHHRPQELLKEHRRCTTVTWGQGSSIFSTSIAFSNSIFIFLLGGSFSFLTLFFVGKEESRAFSSPRKVSPPWGRSPEYQWLHSKWFYSFLEKGHMHLQSCWGYGQQQCQDVPQRQRSDPCPSLYQKLHYFIFSELNTASYGCQISYEYH